MRRYGLLPVWLAAAVALTSLGACGGIPKPTPEPLSVTMKAVADAAKEAGCTVNFSLTFGGGTGQIGGGMNLSNTLSGGCDPSKVQTLQQFGVGLPTQGLH